MAYSIEFGQTNLYAADVADTADAADIPPLVYEYLSNGKKTYIDCTLAHIRMEGAFYCDHCGKELVERDDEGNLKVCDCGEDIGAYLAIGFKPKKSSPPQCFENLDLEQCKECRSRVYFEEIDERGYCLECQNPDYDPLWPKGD